MTFSDGVAKEKEVRDGRFLTICASAHPVELLDSSFIVFCANPTPEHITSIILV
jgi:hypothetical protein